MMPNIKYKEEKELPLNALLTLYNDAGWTAYSKNPEMLVNAIKNSHFVLTAWVNNELIGLIRVVGDGFTIAYIQDVLVLKAYKRRKIGTTLMTKTLEKFKHIRQKVLLTDDTIETRSFYETLGFKACDKGKLVAFIKI